MGRPSIIKQALNRLDSKMAIGASRYDLKQQVRTNAHAAGEAGPWTVSDGKIHSYSTRRAYQQHTLAFVTWARDTLAIRHLDQLDARRDELATRYLQEQIQADRSPYTLQLQRSALRLFFGDAQLAAAVTLPRRERAKITRSRHDVVRDRGFNPANHQALVAFARATGLRRSEIRDLRVDDVWVAANGRAFVRVRNGKGGKARIVPILRGHESAARRVLDGRQDGQRVFERIPSHMDVHSYRRMFAQEMYMQLSGRSLPPASGRLKPSDYNKPAVQQVSQALGHNRLDVVFTYIR